MRTNHNLITRKRIAAASTIMALGVVGCGKKDTSATKQQQPPKKVVVAEPPAPDGDTPYRYAQAVARAGAKVADQYTVPSTYCRYTNKRPQRLYSHNPDKLVVNGLCQTPVDGPISVYNDSASAEIDAGQLRNGDVVDVVCIDTVGEFTTDVRGGDWGSQTWVKVRRDDVTGFVSEVNLGFVRDNRYEAC